MALRSDSRASSRGNSSELPKKPQRPTPNQIQVLRKCEVIREDLQPIGPRRSSPSLRKSSQLVGAHFNSKYVKKS